MGTDSPIPTFSNTDVMGLAAGVYRLQLERAGRYGRRCMVELLYVRGAGIRRRPAADAGLPNHHSTVEKDFLGVTISASANPDPVAT